MAEAGLKFPGVTPLGTAQPGDVPVKPRGFLDPGPPEYAPGAPGGRPLGSPPGTPIEPARAPASTLATKGFQRLMGTDVEHDPQVWPRLGTTIIGAISGGKIGSMFPLHPILGAIAGSAVGAVIGTAAPEMTMEIAEDIGVVNPGTRDKFGLSPQDLVTVMEGEAIVDIATNGGIFAARLLGRGATTATTGTGSIPRALTGASDDSIAKKAYDLGISILPVQVGGRRLARGFTTVFGRMPWMAKPLKVQAQATENELMDVVSKLPTRLAPMATMLDVSRDMVDDVAQVVAGVDATYTARFDKLFSDATAMGIQVQPVVLMQRAEDITAKIQAALPKTAQGVDMEAGKQLQALGNFITDALAPMTEDTGKFIRYQPQEMRAVDTLLTRIDEYAMKVKGSKVTPGTAQSREKDEVLGYIDQLRMGVFQDVLGNASQNIGGKLAPLTPPAQEIVNRFHQTSADLSLVMQDLFDTAAAKRMGVISSRGMRGAVPGEAGTAATDNLAKYVLESESPTVVADIKKIIAPDTFNRLAGAVLNDTVEASFYRGNNGARMFDVDKFASMTGIDLPSSGRYAQTKALLDGAGGLTMDELHNVVDVARKMAEVEVPDVSTFVARRATLGGLRSAYGAIGGTILTGAAAGFGATHDAGGSAMAGLLVAAVTIGGARLFSKIISNPTSAQAIRTVMSEEATITMRRAAMAKALRVAIWAGSNQEWARDKAAAMDELVSPAIQGLFDAFENATTDKK